MISARLVTRFGRRDATKNGRGDHAGAASLRCERRDARSLDRAAIRSSVVVAHSSRSAPRSFTTSLLIAAAQIPPDLDAPLRKTEWRDRRVKGQIVPG